MKRIWIAMAMLIIAVSACFIDQAFINAGYRELCQKVEYAYNSSSLDEKRKYCDEIILDWKEYSDRVSLTVDHSVLLTAATPIGILEDSDKSNSNEIDELLTEIKSSLNVIYSESRFSAKNIL